MQEIQWEFYCNMKLALTTNKYCLEVTHCPIDLEVGKMVSFMGKWIFD